MSIATTKQLGLCQVRSKTEYPCTHQAAVEFLVEFHGIPFCERCVCEQQMYFATGELETQAQGMASMASERELAERIAEAGKQLVM